MIVEAAMYFRYALEPLAHERMDGFGRSSFPGFGI